MNNAAFEMLVACIGAVGCWILWFSFIKEYRVSNFRENLFSIRDDLFLVGAEDQVSFEDPAYYELRAFINGMLRFADRISLLTLVISVKNSHASDHTEDPDPYKAWTDSLITLSPEVREHLEQIHMRLVAAYTNHLVEGSIILFPLALILLVGFALRSGFKRFFSPKDTKDVNFKEDMVKDLARTLNTRILEENAYREGKASEKMELSIA